MTKEKEQTQEKKLEKVKEIIDAVKIGLVTTVGDNGLVSRPMAVQEVEPDGNLWFITFQDGSKIHQIEKEARVNVSFNDKNKNFLSLTGNAKIIRNNEKEKELLGKAEKALFETDADDPNLVLLKVEVIGAEYWESGNMAKVAIEFVSSMLGKKGHDLGDNESVDLK